jgi:glycosyltransferase involved in cell wall biosynthesis
LRHRDLRLLHVIVDGKRRGGSVFASDLSAALAGLGIEQCVAALRQTDGVAVAFEPPVRILGTDKRLLPGLKIDPRVAVALAGVIHNWKPDVIQAHGGEPFKHILAADPRRRHPTVYRRIGGAPYWIKAGWRKIVHASLMRRAAMIIAVSDAVRQETIGLFGVDPVKIRTIPNAVSVARLDDSHDRAEIRRAFHVGAESFVSLSIGSLSWEKDPLCQLEVVDRVLRERSEAIHLFVGDGPMRREVSEAIARRGLSERCFILGSRANVADIYAASDVLLFASRPDGMEGMPATVIEAGMVGLPVAGFSIMGVPEVVRHGVTGLLATSGDIDGLTSHVLELACDPEKRRTMGRAARQHCRSLFDIRTVAPRYLRLYEEMRANG